MSGMGYFEDAYEKLELEDKNRSKHIAQQKKYDEYTKHVIDTIQEIAKAMIAEAMINLPTCKTQKVRLKYREYISWPIKEWEGFTYFHMQYDCSINLLSDGRLVYVQYLHSSVGYCDSYIFPAKIYEPPIQHETYNLREKMVEKARLFGIQIKEEWTDEEPQI
jgi:hypothetical protein